MERLVVCISMGSLTIMGTYFSTDKLSESVILEVVTKNFKDHLILGEEGGLIGDSLSEYLRCIDPLDGTTNFAHGYPSFSLSIGVLFREKPAASTVIVEKAGGVVTRMDGGEFTVFDRSVLVSNGVVHGQLLDRIGPPTEDLKKKGIDFSLWFKPEKYPTDF